jgi:DNA adenine methylase
MKPLLKWVGSKRWISKRIAKIVREEIVCQGTYHEPFVGAGAVLFELGDLDRPKNSYDIVEPLIETYKLIQQNPIGVWTELRALEKDGLDKQTYLLRRAGFNHRQMGYEKWAAFFIYLNHTCYNGLWRTNKDGDFNVPFGDHKNLHLPDQGDFLQACQALQEVNFTLVDHPRQTLERIRQDVEAGDVVFVDPPYIDTFDDYDEFDYDMTHFHEELACILWDKHLHGATVIAMNSNDERIKKWYGAFCAIEEIDRHQGVAGTNEGRGEWSQVLAIAR